MGKQRAGWRPDQLREQREAHGLTLEKAGERLRKVAERAKLKGIPAANPQTLWQHEQGEAFPGPHYRSAYCLLLGTRCAGQAGATDALRTVEVPMSGPLRRIDALVEEDTLPTPQVRQELRLAAGLTQTEVADAIGVKRLAVARWEAGLAQPHRGNRRAYAHLLRRQAAKHPNAAVEEAPDEG